MLTVPGNARLFLCHTPINMRKSFEGLGQIVTELFPNELCSGAFFIFLSKRRDHMKVLYYFCSLIPHLKSHNVPAKRGA